MKKILAVLAFLLCQSLLFATTETFTTSGTWTAPTGVTSVLVEAWGPGGVAFMCMTTDPCSEGGGGGAYAASTISVTPGSNYSYVIGTTYFAGTPYPTTLHATNTAFNGTAVVAAYGDFQAGGTVANSTGTVKYSGGNGFQGCTTKGGGGGSSAGPNSNGNNAVSTTGASAVTGGGAGGSGYTGSRGNGADGLSPGGGGGGCTDDGLDYYYGGSGGTGQIRLTYTAVTPRKRIIVSE
jgi:hypothetical protein